MSEFIKDATCRLFEGEVSKQLIERSEKGEFPSELWSTVVDAGFTRLFCREEDGGIEVTWNDAYDLFYALGYYQVPAPIAETAIAGLLLSKMALLPEGNAPIALCSPMQADICLQNSKQKVSGELLAVKWARHCQYLVIGTEEERLLLVSLDAEGIVLDCEADIAGIPADKVTLNEVPVIASFKNPFLDIEDVVSTLGAAARAMMMVGALEFILEQSVQYAKDRVQFGKPIGRNQVIQQQLSAMAGEVALAYSVARTAAKDLPDISNSDSPSATFSTAAAKVCAGDAINFCTRVAHQVHGAIGFTYEHQLNFATRRLWAWRNDFGSTSWWARRLGTAYVSQGGDAFWDSLVQRIMPREAV